MSRPATFILESERDRQMAIRFVERCPLKMQVKVSKPTRTNDDNARLHALLTDIANQLPWPKEAGELHDVEWWKRRCTFTWLCEIRASPELITTLEGPQQFGMLVPHTSDLDVGQCASLNVWIEAFGATNGVQFKEPKRQPEPPPQETDR